MTHSRPLHDTLLQMQDAVKRGSMNEAARLGQQSVCPLSLDANDVHFSCLLSTGAESRVFKGVYHSIPVAIKQPIIRTAFDLERFRKELIIITSLNHPSIISVLGARVLPPNYFVMMPLEGASYYDILHLNRQRFSFKEIIEIGYQLTGAMMHVHDEGFLHRDIKTKNILMGQDGYVKLIDFGIAKGMNSQWDRGTAPSGGFHRRRVIGTLEYMAPEVLQNQGHGLESDVYAFGVTLNEIATGVYPFSDCIKENPDAHTVLEMGYGQRELASAVVAEGLRPTMPHDVPVAFLQLLERCWRLDPSERPSFGQLHDSFSQMLMQCGELKIPFSVMSVEKSNQQLVLIEEQPFLVDDESEMKGKGGTWLHKGMENDCTLQLSSGSFATAGYRGEDRMEDRHFVTENILDCPSTALIGVFDGHRGYETAQFALDHFEKIFKMKIQMFESAEAALTSTFKDLEMKFEASPMARIEGVRGLRCPGCTAIVAFIHQKCIYIANTGDCRAVLCRNGGAIQLSHDHTASNIPERNRIQKQRSDAVRWERGSWRIGDVGLQVTRSLGDVDLKSLGIISDPEIMSIHMESSDTFLIIASDGLWDALTNNEAVGLVHDTVKQPDLCAKRLVMEAISRGSRDNVTAAVIFLKSVETLECIYANGVLDSGDKGPSGSRGRKVRLPQMSADEMSETF